MINSKSRIFVAGHNGLVGSSVFKVLKENKYKNVLTVDRKKLDLEKKEKVEIFFKKKKTRLFDYMCS